jgi:hypothetical protein
LVELRITPWSPGSGLMLSPSSPTATQRDAEAQEIPRSSSGPSSCVFAQAPPPPVGLAEVTIFASPAEAAQKLTVGQETP